MGQRSKSTFTSQGKKQKSNTNLHQYLQQLNAENKNSLSNLLSFCLAFISQMQNVYRLLTDALQTESAWNLLKLLLL